MNADVEAITAEDHRVDGFQATRIFDDSPIEILRTHQQCVKSKYLRKGPGPTS